MLVIVVSGCVGGRRSAQENCRTFCSALLSCTFSSGLLSGIMPALLSALSWMSGLIFLQSCSPACVMFLQKSTFTTSRLVPCVTTHCRLQSVMRTQFSRWRLRNFLQLCSTEIRSWSVMCAQPDRVSESRLGHMWQTRARKVLTRLSCLLQMSF